MLIWAPFIDYNRVRSACLRVYTGGKSDNMWKAEGMNNTKPKIRKPDKYIRSKLRCQLGNAEFVSLGFFYHLVLSALDMY